MTIEVITSEALARWRHGFFTRKGGVSTGLFASLNCGHGSTDRKETVSINRQRAADVLGISPKRLATVHQVHSATALAADAPFDVQPRADGMASATPGLGLAILTADCQPVLLADNAAQVIGAAHAGWRGALDGILEATVDAMEGLGARAAGITAVIGPSISQRAYEVGPEFLERFVDDDPGNTRFFANGRDDRLQFDLVGYSLQRLRNAGIGNAQWTGHCTYSDPDRFFSYRRSRHRKEPDYGRLISVICL
ncbi:MAG: peptidoglycan editing factor PgeF [Boseongicola sp. SB0675_bin_26]|nr:peptidoglycan editing factor PgeF [Boseongicola sp. SB0675_bin_26]